MDKLEGKAVAMSKKYIDRSLFEHESTYTNAYELWIKLESLIQKKTPRNKAHLIRQLVKFEYSNGQNMIKHLNTSNGIVNQLTKSYMKKDDELQTLIILSYLPESWDTLFINLNNSTSYGKLVRDSVTDSFLNKESKWRERGFNNQFEATNVDNRGRTPTPTLTPSAIAAPAPVPVVFTAPTPTPSSAASPTPTLFPASGGHSNWKKKVIIGLCAAMAFLLLCIMVCYFRGNSLIQQIKYQFGKKNDKDIEAFLKDHGALLQKRYKFSDIKKITNSFKVKLGQGGFGVVYKGKLFNGCLVAVKILNASKENGEDFINEVASITRTSHVNIVTLLGFCVERNKKALIYEFMPNGSLDKFIYNKGPETIASLSWNDLYQISKGIARGLEYLHRGCTTRILHFDIKPHNILLDENFCPKISDFGLAKLCLRKESIISMSNQRGTMGYVAPEVWNRHFGGVSHKSDVYSYGMMLLEMVGGRKNVNADASNTSEIYFPHWVYSRLELGSDLRPDGVMDTEEDEIARRMTIVGLWCIQTFPSDRPTMSKVIEMLEVNMSSLEIPPKPLLSSPTRSISKSSSS
ncbi:PR5-like receptor kinase [Vicia villosa]|uniref:PR5-like receptor kinase n=1 Tax=Vicia villosa TaxID=3911 RepID=UPI00273C1C38|nr:PR5-like receptor kinase [Vicia villosa]